jgi:hypothetical protein
MSKKLYVAMTIKETGIDSLGAFALVNFEISTDKKETVVEKKIHIDGRAWFSNKYDNYKISDIGSHLEIIHSDTKG